MLTIIAFALGAICEDFVQVTMQYFYFEKYMMGNDFLISLSTVIRILNINCEVDIEMEIVGSSTGYFRLLECRFDGSDQCLVR